MGSLIAIVDVPAVMEWKETVMGVRGCAPAENFFGLEPLNIREISMGV